MSVCSTLKGTAPPNLSLLRFAAADSAHVMRVIHWTTFELPQRLEPCAHLIHQKHRTVSGTSTRNG